MEKQKFISEEQRDRLREAYEIIEGVEKEINHEYTEVHILFNTLDALKRAIRYEEIENQ